MDFIAARTEIKYESADLLSARYMIKYAVMNFMATRIVFEIFSADFMPFRAFVKLLWQFVAKILGDVAENVYLRSRNQQKEKDYVVLFLGEAAAEEV